MKRIAWAGVLALAAGLVSAAVAQGEIQMVPNETVQQLAPRLVEMISQNLPNTPVKVDGNTEKAVGYRAEGPAILIVPDRGISAKTVGAAGEKTVPAGIVALRKLSPVVDGKTLAPEKLARLGPEGEAHEIGVMFVGVRKEADKLMLEVYSTDAKPLCKVPLTIKTQTESGMPPLTAKFTNVDRTAKQADMVLTIDGAYDATVRMGGRE